MQTFFDSYAQGYIDQDFACIAKHFSYPCMLTNQSGTDLICDDDDLQQHVAGFLAYLQENGLTKATPTIVHDMRYGADNRVVSVNWKLFGAGEQPFAELEYLYVLVGGDGRWKVSLANPI